MQINFIAAVLLYIKVGAIEECLNEIRPYSKDIVNDLKRKYHTWKIQLTIAFNFVSSKDNDEERVIHPKCDNIKLMINDKEDEVMGKRFESLQISIWVGNINQRQ